DRLVDRGQRWVEVPGYRHVVEAGDGDLVRHLDAPASQRVHRAEGCLVVGADNGAGQRTAGVEQRHDHLGGAFGAVVALPAGSGLGVGTGRGCLGFERARASLVVGAVGVPGEITDAAI